MKQLTPEEKVQITANMSDAITRVSLEGIKANYPGFSEKETVELLRERIKQRRR
ncbi:hypothetical protein GF326_11125 [Candidatus Bathyarchaeota archaeon]|nr:hypothetical protein [Candidatus Bathyarchaeota archaeon]